ncbi:MAG TPA: ParA family protein, partial [Allocoleopsis sp.]
DTPARPEQSEIESLANGCDLLILPTTPDPLSLSALAQIARSLPEGTNYRILLTMVPPPPQKDGEQALEALKRNGFPVFSRTVRRYKAYIKASDLGVPVHQAPGGNTAWRDWKELSKELKDAIR